ncbi:penicillin-insensitive murein endopeptidase [Paraconexibacter algicola]|uniref:Penicillin-insensitive murein endopeptidase n=1 Tax=Paraconexibacter algicola TaxID=2133960 RepID=A0A2T4UC20_9ACTN|nr:penicillin-insensitive murein endopeptidase [Paraconexibacter algicola]PTL54775.1 hypothetical protein C7Y72_19465 [Paraconexibacter algicola]
MRGPLLLLLASVVLGAGAAVAAVTERSDGLRPPGLTARTAAPSGSAVARATPLPPALAPAPAVPAPTPAATPTPVPTPPSMGTAPASRALGRPFRDGRLENGVLLPAQGPDHRTWDAPLQRSPSRAWRRWGTDVLVATVLEVLAEHRAAHPESPPILVGDLSRPRGGIFDQRYGGLGHASHQNGLDVDIYYPRKDRLPIEPARASQVDRRLSQDLVDRFLARGAEFVFVGRNVRLRGPKARVSKLPHHDDHLHVRIPDPDGVGGR